MLRYHIATELFPEDHIICKNVNRITQFEGLVIDYQYKNDYRNKYLLSLEKISISDTLYSASGKVLLYTKEIQNTFDYGDKIQVNASLEIPSGKRNPGQFDYRQYLANQNIFYISRIVNAESIKIVAKNQGNWFIQAIIMPMRRYCLKTFVTYFDRQTAGLIMALILGEKQALNEHMIDSFKKVGVVHVLAISGLHVGFIISFVFSLLSLLRLRYQKKIWGLFIVLLIYIILIRFKTPVIRASSMAILYLGGQVLERKVSTYNIIFAAMTIILLFDPQELFNPGFQFSFIAVLSIIYGYDLLDTLLPLNRFLEKKLKRTRWVSYLRKSIWIPFLVSLAAVIGTSPLTIYYYGFLPVYAVLANLLVIPLTGVLVFLSLFLLCVGGISEILGSGLGILIQFINQFLQKVVEIFANLPDASIITSLPTLIQILLMYFIILSSLNVHKNKKLFSFTIFIFILLFFITLRIDNSRDLQVTFLDVGQGDAAFLKFPNQKSMLIDAGNRSVRWDQGEKTILPFLQFSHSLRINYLVGSHPHNDHIGGFLTLLNEISIDTLVLSAYPYNSIFYKNLLQAATNMNIPIKMVMKGDMLVPDPLCRVYVLHPDSSHIRSNTFNGAECNNSSVVLKVAYGANSILFTGDLEETGEQPILQYNKFLESEILKVGHHGSSTSTSEELLKSVNPILAIISVARKNKFRHPSPRTLRRLKQHGIVVYQTKHEGAITFKIGPEKMTKVFWK